MTIMMPAADQAVLARRETIVAALRKIVPGEGVISSAAEMLPYESDGLMAYRQPPMVVVLPDTTEQVSKVLRYCFDHGIKVVPRGSGTSLSGGALPLADAVLLGLGKFKRIREIDLDNRAVITEPGKPGEMHIAGGNVMSGYWRSPELTAAAFDGEWFKTGDVGVFDEDGYLEITGRIKEQYKLENGKYVGRKGEGKFVKRHTFDLM